VRSWIDIYDATVPATDALSRRLRELVATMASLYPDPMGVEEALEVTGLRAIAGQRTHKLSGGQTQRVRFALAIVCNPDLLVLDEPTVAVDVEGRRELWSIMRELAARGKTVLFATHYLEEADADADADRAILMAHGRIVADGPTTEVKARVGRRTLRATLPDVDPSVGPLMGGLVSILAFLSGTWFAITSGFLHGFGQFLPSWWLVQARNVALDGHAWGARGWITVAAWTRFSLPAQPGHIVETRPGFSPPRSATTGKCPSPTREDRLRHR
jgi:hypothetical protein